MSGSRGTPSREPLKDDEMDLYTLLRKAGWSDDEAYKEARRALDDAELEAGYDGP